MPHPVEVEHATPRPPARSPRRPRRFRWLLLGIVGALAAGLGWPWARGHFSQSATRPAGPIPAQEDAIPHADVVRPRPGGLPRKTVQPGSVYAFEAVDLYAMVSGYLKAQEVDIGSRVEKGQVLAVIDAPREAQAVAEAAALLEQARAQALQAAARIRTAEAERETADAALDQSEADVARLVAGRELAQKQYTRIRDLAGRNAIEGRLVDEEKNRLDTALAAEKTAQLAVATARAKRSGADAALEQARADRDVAVAAVGVAEARLAKARVDLEYARVTAPFDGVVTHRQFHPGAFVRAAADGNQPALLRLLRTDLMRVVVRVPDRDVLLADVGDPAELTIDALGGRTFQGTVARVADSEDHETRTMRVEIDLPNPDGALRDGMYGRATIGLQDSNDHLSLPVACVLERTGKGKGAVRVVRDGRVARVPVELGADDGSLIEVVSGLEPRDQVVVRSSVPLEDEMRVVAVERE